MKTPLNGTRTHPLSDHAWDMLDTLAHGMRERHTVNAGVFNRFDREGLAIITRHAGKHYVQITQAGRDRLASGKR